MVDTMKENTSLDPFHLNTLSSVLLLAVSLSTLLIPGLLEQTIGLFETLAESEHGSSTVSANNVLDPIIRCGMRGAGACSASLAFYELFLASPRDQPALLRYKMVLFACHVGVFLHTMWNHDILFVQQFLGSTVALKVILGARTYQVYQKYVRSQANSETSNGGKGTTLSSLVTLSYTLPFALCMLFHPRWLAQLYYRVQQDVPFEGEQEPFELNPAQLLALRYEGATLLATSFHVWDTRRAPLAQVSLLGAALYSFVFMDGALDTTGATRTTAFGLTLMVHYVYVSFLALEFSREPTTLKGVLRSESQIMESQNIKDESVPPLVPVGTLRSNDPKKPTGIPPVSAKLLDIKKTQ